MKLDLHRLKLWWVDSVAVGLIFLAAFAVNCAPEWFFPKAHMPRTPYLGVRFLYDAFDKDAYIRCGSYVLVPSGAPYRDASSEYPQLATYLFSIPFEFARNRVEYHHCFTWMMALCLVAAYLVVRRVCVMLGHSPRRAWLLLLPGTLYFTLNRFDIVPALITVTAVWALLKERIPLAFALLAAGVMTKLYPVLYVPFFAVFVYRKYGWKKTVRGLAAFGLVLACLWAQLVWRVGSKLALTPYRLQGTRSFNYEGLFYILSLALPSVHSWVGRLVFYAAQLSPLLALPWLSLRRPEQLLRWMTVITISFVVFMRIQSPQWIVWITPLAVLACCTSWELVLVAALDVMGYLYFPVLFDTIGERDGWFVSFILALTALRLALVVFLVREIRPAQSGSSS